MCKTEILKENILNFMLQKAEDYGEDQDDIYQLIASIDFSKLYQAIQNKAEPVYGFSLKTIIPGELEYRGNRLFPGNACKIYEFVDWGQRAECVFDICHYTELWILDDMSLAVISGCQLTWDETDYIADYREFKGNFWPDEESFLGLAELGNDLKNIELQRDVAQGFSWSES